MASDIESLYALVTEAIRRAETLEDVGAPGAAQAYLDVSLLEERIATLVSAADPEGAVARRGAVRAAVAADAGRRARELARRYASETEASAKLRAQLAELVSGVDDPSKRPPPSAVPLALGRPVQPRHLVGRNAERDAVLRALEQGGVVLTGRRRIGKSSLALSVAHQVVEDRWLVVWLPAEALRSPADLAVALTSRIREGHAGSASPATTWQALEYAARTERDHTFAGSLPRILQALNAPVLLIIDNIDDLPGMLHAEPSASHGPLAFLRGLREQSRGLRMLLIASAALRRESGGAMDDLRHVRLDPLSHADATTLAAALFRQSWALERDLDELAAAVAEQAGGEPYFVQQITAALLATRPEGATPADAAAITEAAIRDPADPWSLRMYFTNLYFHYRSDADVALAALDLLAERGDAISASELVRSSARRTSRVVSEARVHEVLRGLEDDQYLVSHGAGFAFASRLLQRAWASSGNTSLWVKQELLGVRLRRAVTAALRGDTEALEQLPAAERRLARQMLSQIGADIV